MKLNLGCGRALRADCVNLDIRPLPGAIQCDVSDPRQMAKYEGCEAIYAHDILEHFDREIAQKALALWVSLLADGGLMEIRTPDIWRVLTLGQARGYDWLERHLYGDAGVQAHRTCIESGALVGTLCCLGMSVTEFGFDKAGNLFLVARKGVGDNEGVPEMQGEPA